ncbi:uncharacterized protein LOC126696256 [Quercus robur]|uniref:uncharacterized protein LOC126696256 n=1 Tax=Quercus robur TaxID=38942 RepID=UPI002162E3AD|nr:uncharacterized protein LOC126696256 [Quercus robur]
MGLRLRKALGAKNLLVQNDSKLVIGQIRGEYEAKEERLQKYLKLTKHLTQEFNMVEFVQIPRSQNMGEDEVSKLSSSEEGEISTDLVMEVQKHPSIEEVPTFTIRSWVEAEALAAITEARIRSFVWKNIICRLGIPLTIISDNGRQFGSQGFRDFCSNLGIKNQFSSPGHPPGKRTDGSNESNAAQDYQRQAGRREGCLTEELPNVMWAYRTTARTPTGETPFRLTYGTEVVILIEVGVTSIRRETFNEECNDDELRLNLDCLDEVRDKTSSKMTKYQLKMAEYYNKRVKLRRLDIGDLVLRKITTATKDPAQGNLGPTWEGPYRVVHYSRSSQPYNIKWLSNKIPP